jgi:hypothetical protein
MPGNFEPDVVYQCGGEVVADTDQKAVIARIAAKTQTSTDDLDAGVCVALSKKWVLDTFFGKDYWNSLNEESTLREVATDFRKYEQMWDREAAKLLNIPLLANGTVDPKSAEKALRTAPTAVANKLQDVRELADCWARIKIGMEIGGEGQTKEHSKADQNKLWQYVAENPGLYLLHYDFDGAAHTVAAYSGPGGYHLMDPNTGEMKFDDGENFQKYLQQHSRYYRDNTGVKADMFPMAKLNTRPDLAPNQHARHCHPRTLLVEAAHKARIPPPPVLPATGAMDNTPFAPRTKAEWRKGGTKTQLLARAAGALG